MVVVESRVEEEEELGFLASSVSSVGGSGVAAWVVVDVKRVEYRDACSRPCGRCLVEERKCLVIVPLLRNWTGLRSQDIMNWADHSTLDGAGSLEKDGNH